jgi:hypothetical protein
MGRACSTIGGEEEYIQDIGGIDVAEGRDQWRALVNTVMNLQVS